MKGYTIEHRENSVTKKPVIIEQLNFHRLKQINFYGWHNEDISRLIQTVAIFKIKWKS